MKFFFSDVDGTFIIDRKIPEINIQATRELEEKGHRFILVSGRSVQQIEDVLAEGDFQCDYIYGNGAGYKLLGEEPVLKYFIHENEYDYWERVLTDNDAFYIMHTSIGQIMQPLEDLSHHFDFLKETYHTLYGEEVAQYIEDKKHNYYGKEAIFKTDPFQFLRENEDVKLIKFELLNGSHKTRETIQNIARNYGYLAFSSMRINLEIVPSQSNKGDAIQSYLDLFDDVKKTYGFGDALNDLQMFDVVDVSVAAANAMDEIKAICEVNLTEDIGSYILKEIQKEI